MTRKLATDEIILVPNETGEKVRRIQSWSCISLYALTVVVVGAVITVVGVQVLLVRESNSPLATFKLIATRSAVSLSTWIHHVDGTQHLLSLNTVFSEELGNPEVCEDKALKLCVKWSERKQESSEGVLKVREVKTPDDIICHEHVITVTNKTHITSCIPLHHEQLYGGAISGTQYWPSQKNIKQDSAFVTGLGGNGGIVEPYWLMSSGKVVFVPPDVPLFVSQNKSILCLTGKIADPYLPDSTGNVSLKYTVCSGSNPIRMHLYAMQNFFSLPQDIPDKRMMQYPIWSTWARYKKLIDADIVNHFADEIITYSFNNSQLEIDDNWEVCYGAAEFFKETFPDPGSLVEVLKKKGFRVTLWTHPFINVICPAHDFAERNNFLASSRTGSTFTVWWDGIAGMINFTKPEAVTWWEGRLKNLSSQFGFDAFKFDAGEAAYLPGAPQVSHLEAPTRLQPNVFTTDYVKTVANISKLNLAEVRVVYRNQEEPIFVRMSDKASTWSIENGLKALVTTLLAMNMVGYSFVMPDMVGGNGYGNYPSKELFIRWLQANTFMPTIQFSYVPWDYDNETVEIAKKFTALHYRYSDTIIQLARKRIADGSPINPPIWWIDPTDTEALTIDTEFLLGDSLLVAPVLEENAVSRDIYLPCGLWRDELHSVVIPGKQWLRNFTVQLSELAYFTKIS